MQISPAMRVKMVGRGSQKDLAVNPDTSVDVYYGPLEPWFDETWRPGEIERVD